MANHMTELNIETFRGITNLEIKDLGDVNIILGKNNCGKTSLLEAISAFRRPNEINTIVDLALTRQQIVSQEEVAESVSYAFNKRKSEEIDIEDRYEYVLSISSVINNKTIDVSVVGWLLEKIPIDNNKIIEVAEVRESFEGSIKTVIDGKPSVSQFEVSSSKDISVPIRTNNLVNIRFIPNNANLVRMSYGALKEILESGKKEQVIRIMKTFDNEIVDFNIVEQKILVINGNDLTMMPLFNYGSGMQNAILFIPLAIRARNGILLIDEIETAIHKESMKSVFKVLFNVCKENNVQLFITSHSIEAVDEMLLAAENENSLENIRVITLNKLPKKNKTKARVLTGKEAMKEREDLKMELRI